MQRLKSVDSYRGIIMVFMLIVHLIAWWIVEEDRWFDMHIYFFIDRVFSPGFLLVSGLSATLYLRSRFAKAKTTEDYDETHIRNEYLFRGLIICIIGLIYNFFVALGAVILTGDIINFNLIWTWFMLFTIGSSLLLGWSLLKTTKVFRICFIIFLWVLNFFIFNILLPHQGEFSTLGVIFHLLYNNPSLDPIIPLFGFFLVGSVIGDFILEAYELNEIEARRLRLKNTVLKPCFIMGGGLVIFALIFQYPYTFNIASFSWLAFALGMNIIVIAFLLTIEEFELIKTKKRYRFLFFLSYYSLTLYLAHNLLYFVFLHQLRWYYISFVVFGAICLNVLFYRALYNSKWRDDVALKIQIGKMARRIVNYIDNRKKRLKS